MGGKGRKEGRKKRKRKGEKEGNEWKEVKRKGK